MNAIDKAEEGNICGCRIQKKVILSLVLILAILAMAAMFLADRKHMSEQQSRLRRVVEEMKSLEREREDLEQELEKLDESDPDVLTRSATAQIVVTELQEDVYTALYPDMKRYGMNGVLAFSGETFPGGDGRITREQFDEMMEDGWDACLFWDGGVELESWLSDMEEYLVQEELAMPGVLYVDCAPGTWKDDAICRNHGISIVVHRQESGEAAIATGADAASLVSMDQESMDSLTDPSVMPEEEVIRENGAGVEEMQGASAMAESASALPAEVAASSAENTAVSAEGGEPGYRYSAASASNAGSPAAAFENPIVEPLQAPLTQAIQEAVSDDILSEENADDVWHLESLVWSGQDLVEIVSSLAERGGNLTVELQLPIDKEGEYQSDETDAFLNSLRSGGLELRSFAEARETTQEHQRSREEWGVGRRNNGDRSLTGSKN